MRSRDRKAYEAHGDVFFITSTVVGFLEIFRIPSLCEIMLGNLKFYSDRRDFTLLAYVIMPNHFHSVIKVHSGRTISKCIANLKRITSRQVTEWLEARGCYDLLEKLHRAAADEPARDCKIWKPRFDCLVLQTEKVLRQKIEYIHNNPVKKNLVEDCANWAYSSARNYAGREDVLLEVDTQWRCLSQ